MLHQARAMSTQASLTVLRQRKGMKWSSDSTCKHMRGVDIGVESRQRQNEPPRVKMVLKTNRPRNRRAP